MVVFPIFYFPPISWFAALKSFGTVTLELHQHYRKQQYHNRCYIKSANKVLRLTVPVVRTGENQAILDKQVSYMEPWQKLHWKSIESAYRSAPYFEYYEEDFGSLFEQNFDTLTGLNLATIKLCMNWLKLEAKLEFTSSYQDSSAYLADLRQSFEASGKKTPDWFNPRPYTQVFEGFSPDLSILDLIFNLGPEAAYYLNEAILPEYEWPLSVTG